MNQNKKCINFIAKLQCYSIIINDPYNNGIRVVKQGVSDIIDIKPHILLDGAIPINSNLKDVLVNKKIAYFYFDNFGYLKIKIKNLINKKKCENKSNWDLIIKNNHYKDSNIIIPNEFERFANLNSLSFGLYKTNLDLPYWNILTINLSKIININLYDFLLKLGISTDYNADGLALDTINNLIYVRFKNSIDDVLYIYTNINSNCIYYNNWNIIQNQVGDNTMEETNKDTITTELEKKILDNTIEENEDKDLNESDEQYMRHAMFPHEESVLDLDDENNEETNSNDDNVESEDYKENEFFKAQKESEKITNDLDEFIKSNSYFDTGILTMKKFIKNISDKEIYFDDLNTACSKLFTKEIKKINDENFKKFVSSIIGNKSFDSFKNMLYIAELFTKNNPFKYYNDFKSIEIKGFSAFDSYFSETENSEIHFETSFESFRNDNCEENNIGLRIELTVYTKYKYIDENNKVVKQIIPMGTVVSNINKLDNPYETSLNKYMITVPNVSNNLFDYAKTITYIEQSVNSRCVNCCNIGNDCCLRVGGPLKNDEVNITIKDGYIPVSDSVVDFLKNSKKLTADIYAACSVSLNRD